MCITRPGRPSNTGTPTLCRSELPTPRSFGTMAFITSTAPRRRRKGSASGRRRTLSTGRRIHWPSARPPRVGAGATFGAVRRAAGRGVLPLLQRRWPGRRPPHQPPHLRRPRRIAARAVRGHQGAVPRDRLRGDRCRGVRRCRRPWVSLLLEGHLRKRGERDLGRASVRRPADGHRPAGPLHPPEPGLGRGAVERSRPASSATATPTS